MKKEIIESIKENRLYDFVANHYWEMSNNELRDVLLELNYEMYNHGIKDNVILEALEDRWSYELEEEN